MKIFVLCIVALFCMEQTKPNQNIKTHTLTPDKDGRVEIDAKKAAEYKPGDVIYLKGSFKNIWITGLTGSAAQPIVITNYPGEVTTIGNPDWRSGANGQGIRFANCRHFVVGGENNASEFILDGSTTGSRGSYFSVELCEFSDNAEIKNMTIKNGGTGIWAKTDPKPNAPNTWHPNAYLNNLYIHHVIITGTNNEGMYIGHTATWWNLAANTSFYDAPASGPAPGKDYVQPIMWKNVKISGCYLYNIGLDGIQTAAIDGLEICNNEVTNWAMSKTPSHNGGILIGGRTVNTKGRNMPVLRIGNQQRHACHS